MFVCCFTYPNHRVILILPNTFVSIEVNYGRVDTMMLQVVVDYTDDSVGSLSSQEGFVNQEIDLLRIASQQTPNIPHFHGVRKYIGPGCKGFD